jgi:hypothetical protein
MKIMVDLFCGRGGWTKGFMAHGWECLGIDLHPQPEYPGTFMQADIAQLYELPEADFYCCSSPCEQFSVHGMKHFHPTPKWPWFGIALFEHSRNLLEATGKPYVMENVRATQKFIGPSVNHCGPFHLWGNGVPAIMPRNAYDVKKGITMGLGDFSKMTLEQRREKRKGTMLATVYGTPERDVLTAKAAEIPVDISLHIAQMAGAM